MSAEITTLYRAFDGHGQLLYVGITNCWLKRFGEHARNTNWFAKAIRFEVEQFQNPADALAAELRAIKSASRGGSDLEWQHLLGRREWAGAIVASTDGAQVNQALTGHRDDWAVPHGHLHGPRFSARS
jgi:hypothetical protein